MQSSVFTVKTKNANDRGQGPCSSARCSITRRIIGPRQPTCSTNSGSTTVLPIYLTTHCLNPRATLINSRKLRASRAFPAKARPAGNGRKLRFRRTSAKGRNTGRVSARTPRWARRALTTEPVAVLRFLAMATTGAIEIAAANTRLATDSVVRAEQPKIDQRLPKFPVARATFGSCRWPGSD